MDSKVIYKQAMGERKHDTMLCWPNFFRSTQRFIVEANKVRALACWPYYFKEIHHLSERRKFHHWQNLHTSLKERRILQRYWGKEPPCWGFFSTIAQIILFKCLVFIFYHQQSIKGDPFCYFVEFFTSLRIIYVFISLF